MKNIKLVNEDNLSSELNTTENFALQNYPHILLSPARIAEPTAWVEHIPFAFFITTILKPKILVELGVHTGNSYFSFCQTVKNLSLNTSVYGVDTWIGDEHAEFYDESIYNDISGYNNLNYSNFSSLIRGRFDDALQYFSEGTIDILHIDGYHTYEAVSHDFNTWLPKMSKRGVVLLHDTQVRVNNFGVWKFFEELTNKFTTFQFLYGYGLGVVLVGEEIPEEFKNFIDIAKSNSYIQNLFSVLGRKNLLRHQVNQFADTITKKDTELSLINDTCKELQAEIGKKDSYIRDLENSIQEAKTNLNKVFEIELRNVELEEKYFSNNVSIERIRDNFLLQKLCSAFGIKL